MLAIPASVVIPPNKTILFIVVELDVSSNSNAMPNAFIAPI
jgi:hypothetical protein